MSFDTLERSPPPFFKQGPSALTRLAFFSAMAFFLMVADVRLGITLPMRAAIGLVLQPLERGLLLPPELASQAYGYLQGLQEARSEAEVVRLRLVLQAERAGKVEQLELENARLRRLLELRATLGTTAQAAEVLYDAPDPYTRKVVIDRGTHHDVERGAPVVDETGVLGQVTRVYPLTAEVTLLTDRDAAIPVLNTRNGLRSLAFGMPRLAGGVELRFVPAIADVQEGDLLSTSGVDGVYPAGLPVARVSKVERRPDSDFARIECELLGRPLGARHVLVLKPVGAQLPPRPEAVTPAAAPRKGGRK